MVASSSTACYQAEHLRASNNRYPNCPPMMSDGRAFTDYRPKGVQAIQDVVPLNKGSYEYRQHLESHGDALITGVRRDAYTRNTCGPCKLPYAQGTVPPELARESCGPNACSFVQESVDGIGMGRNFGETPEVEAAYHDFYNAKMREQVELSREPCDLSYDPFRDFPVRYAGPGPGRLESPEGGGGP